MEKITIFVLGAVIGAGLTYFYMRLGGSAVGVSASTSKKEEGKRKILAALRKKGTVTNNDVEALIGVSDATATRYMEELEQEGKVLQQGREGRGVTYTLKS